MPVFQQMIDSNIPDKPIIFAIDTDPMETAYVVNKFEASLGVHILAGLDSDGKVTDLYQIVFKPRTFVIDSQGVIRYDQLGEMTLDMLRVYLFKLSPGYF